MLKPYTKCLFTNFVIFNESYKYYYLNKIDSKNRCKNISNDIFFRYANYKVGELLTDTVLPDIKWQNYKETLVELFDKKAQPFKSAESYILQLNNATCSYCLLKEAEEVDHFLPKGEYPEYSLFTPNLLPACGGCNGKRKKKIKTLYKNNIRVNFNLIEDKFVKKMFIYTLVWNKKLLFINVKTEFNLNLTQTQLTIIKEHYDHITTKGKTSLLINYSEQIEKFFKLSLDGYVSNIYTCSNFSEFWIGLKKTIYRQFKEFFDYLWFYEALKNNRVNLKGLYLFLKFIYINKNDLKKFNLEPWFLNALK